MKPTRLLLSTIFVGAILSACGGGNLNEVSKDESELDAEGNYSGKVKIEWVTEPTINYGNDKIANIVVQFIPRTQNNLPLSPEQVDITLQINDRDIGVESRLSSSSEALAYNVHYSLVLDASYSMLVSQSFNPMLNAAKRSVEAGLEIWNQRPGKFTFQATWFDSFIYASMNNETQSWTSTDITTIPAPLEDTYTKLYASIDYALDAINNRADTENSQNVMLIFSDGEDTYSFVNNSGDEQTNSVSSGAEYIKTGRVETTLATVLNKIRSAKNLSVHVVGLGENIDADSLTAIANASNGLYLPNPQTDEIVNLFDRVTKEFTTLQSQGVKKPLNVGVHKFTLIIKNKANGVTTEYNFRLQLSDTTSTITAIN